MTPLHGKAALTKFLEVSNFGQRIWVKASWDLPIQPPKWWKLRVNESGESIPVNYVFQLESDSLTRFRWSGKEPGGTTIWKAESTSEGGFDYLHNLSNSGATIYFYPNQPSEGISNKHVQETNLLFYEIDHLSLDEQWKSVNKFAQSGLPPTAVVFTGGKSLHVYYRLSRTIKIDAWVRLNRKLTIIQDGDPAICNAARAMRLPGMVRRKVADGNLTEPSSVSLVEYNPIAYSPEGFEKILDESKLFPHGLSDDRWRKWRKAALKARSGEDANPIEILLKPEADLNPKPFYTASTAVNITIDPSFEFPLEICLTRDDRELIANGLPEGSRDNMGYKLAANIRATVKKLEKLRYQFVGDPEGLFHQYCDRCNPPIPTFDRDRIWNQAESASKAALDDACLENCIKAWQFKNKNTTGSPKPSKKAENFQTWAGKEGIAKNGLVEASPQIASIQKQSTSNSKSQKCGKQPSIATCQVAFSLPQPTIFDISNPPLVVSFPTQSLRDGIFKVLPIPESVASCLTTEKKAPRKERRWFESILKRVKKAFLKSAEKEKSPKLGFNCFDGENKAFEEKIRQVQRKLRSLSYPADIVLNERYLPDELVNQLPKSGLIGIKCPKGGGKSVLLKKVIALAKKQGIPILSITPRIALGREQAVKWEITWIDDYGVMQTRAQDTTNQISEVAKKRDEARRKLVELDTTYNHQTNLLDNSESEKLEQQKVDLRVEIEKYDDQIENIKAASINTLALCWDSLWRTENRNLQESLIIIDEAELGFKHLVSGSTCKRNRPYLLKTFKDKLIECLMSGGRVVLSDADLTDLPINYIREILPIAVKPFIVTNKYISDDTRWIVDLRTGQRGDTLEDILEAIRHGSHLAITTDSQAEAEALEKLILQKFPDVFCSFLDDDGKITEEAQAREKALIIRIDSETTDSEAGKTVVQHPNEQIQHWKPRILIYSPSMGVGVSIDEETQRQNEDARWDEEAQRWDEDWQEMVPYFDAVYGLFFGVLEPSQCRQQLARFRANVPRIVYCKESNKALKDCSSFFPEDIKRQTLKYNRSALNILDIAQGIAGYEADDEQTREVLLQLLIDAWDNKSRCWKEPSIDLASAFKARENYGLWNLANLLREELEDEGHTVITIEGSKTDVISTMKDIKDSSKLKKATQIAEASTMPVEEARKILNKLGASKEEQHAAQKTLLQEELPGINLTPEFIKKAVVDDRRHWLNQQKMFWYFRNPEATKQIDTDHWLNNLKRFAEGTPFMRDMRSFSPKVQALMKSGVFEFVNLEDCDRIYQGDSPEGKAFLKRCLEQKDLLQTALNVTVTKKSSPIALANRILDKVCLELEKVTRSHKDNRWKLSASLLNDPDRLNVLNALDLRWQNSLEEAEVKKAEKQAQTQSGQAIQLGGEVASYINTIQSSPPNTDEKSHEGVCGAVGQLSLVAVLKTCQSVTQFAAITEGYSEEQIDTAIALSDSQPRRQQLTEWLGISQDCQGLKTVSSWVETYQEGDEVWAYFPQSEAKWLKATVEWVRDRMIRVKSGFLGMLIEREDLIAPGHWQLSSG